MKYKGLSPFSVLQMEVGEVFELYTDSVIADNRAKQLNGGIRQGDVWVTSANATWH